MLSNPLLQSGGPLPCSSAFSPVDSNPFHTFSIRLFPEYVRTSSRSLTAPCPIPRHRTREDCVQGKGGTASRDHPPTEKPDYESCKVETPGDGRFHLPGLARLHNATPQNPCPAASKGNPLLRAAELLRFLYRPYPNTHTHTHIHTRKHAHEGARVCRC